MHKLTIAILAIAVLLTGCASSAGPVPIDQQANFDDAPTGTLIKRRPLKDANGNIVKVDRNLSSDPSVIGTFDTKQQ